MFREYGINLVWGMGWNIIDNDEKEDLLKICLCFCGYINRIGWLYRVWNNYRILFKISICFWLVFVFCYIFLNGFLVYYYISFSLVKLKYLWCD